MGYKEANPDADKEESAKVGSGVPFWTPPGGERGNFITSYIRILPPRDDHPTDSYFYWVSVHGGLPGAQRPVLCPAKMFSKPCPACQEARALEQRGHKDEARDFWPSWKCLVNIVVLDSAGNLEEDGQSFMWAMPKQVKDDLDAKLKKLSEKGRNIASPKKGRNIEVNRKGKGAKDTRYEINFGDISEVSDDIMEIIEADDGMTFLPDVYQELEYNRIAGLLEPPHDEDAFEGEYRELPQETKTGKSQRRREPEPEDDDDPPFDPDDDDDEDEQPPAAPPRRKGATTDDARSRLEASLGNRLLPSTSTPTSDDDDEDDD